ncbi:MAG: hypothetical protein SVW77_01620 [Candidatus Nanohaloarchaea archaeon]|nr:hypothetical protein [Candidatus Nanohaloarchaea archaeon]
MDDTVEHWLEEEFEDRWTAFASDGPRAEARSTITDSDSTGQESGEERPRTPELAVVEQDLPGHLFGFTRRDASHVVVNRNLYRVDKKRTVRHEKTHHRHPDDEMTIRYINGDPDVRHTLSFQGNTPARLGTGSRGVTQSGAAAYSETGDRYGAGSGTYL